MMQFDCLIRPDSSFSRASAAVSWPVIEICPPDWGQCRYDSAGNIVKDSEGKPIVDNLVKIRSAKGKNICQQFISPIPL